MTDAPEPQRLVIDRKSLPEHSPTHKHSAEFWEALGRAVATFGFLEEILGKAIFSFSATREISEDEFEAEYKKWLPTLEKALVDPLGSLIKSYGEAVRANNRATITNLDDLLEDLRSASKLRNVLCHGSWGCPDDQGRSIPFYVDRDKHVFQDSIDIAYLQQEQQNAANLAFSVIDTVTHMGWQFPGSAGPGIPIV